MNNKTFMEVAITYPGKVEPGRTVTEIVKLKRTGIEPGAPSVPDYLEFMAAITRAETVMESEPEAYMTVTYPSELDGEDIDVVIAHTEEDLLGQVDRYTIKTNPGEDDYIYSISEWVKGTIVYLIRKEA